MANDKPNNPADNFSEMVTQWERNFNEYANKVMGTEGFSQAMNEAQKAQLGYQKMFSDWMTQNLTTMNMPTRDDILRLSEAIAGIDQRLERIEANLAGSPPGSVGKPAAKKPPRTRKPKSPAKKASAKKAAADE
jgi:hypothetical protein